VPKDAGKKPSHLPSGNLYKKPLKMVIYSGFTQLENGDVP
jgi:hypothetical protein